MNRVSTVQYQSETSTINNFRCCKIEISAWPRQRSDDLLLSALYSLIAFNIA